LIVVKLAAGICEITKKLKHAGGTDIVLRDETYVLTSLTRFKSRILSLGKRILVSFATIPPVSFQQAFEYNLARKKVWNSLHTDNDRALQQDRHLSRLQQINHAIVLENTKSQSIQELGSCRPSQLLWHLQVLRETRRRKNSKKILRIPLNALRDGVHPGPEVAEKWRSAVHRSLFKDVWELLFLIN
jgi:hypothetical protein